ncbi:MAG: hypothetical protein HKP42_11265 [Maribacter sp.]|nr:hypothetical protein [Maribacter sp.]
MLKFFRQLRKGLLETGSLRKYLFYALGEVFLVMVGILLALQVNNWNEFKKDRAREKEILNELYISVRQNLVAMEEDVLRRKNWNKSSDVIISTFENNGTYSDTLNIHFQNARIPGTNLALSNAGYEGLKNAGYEIIQSKELRNSIVQLYEVIQRNLVEEMEYFESFQPDRQRLVDELFSYEEDKFDPESPFTVPLEPHDFKALKDNMTYLAMVKSVKVQRNIIGVHLNRLLNESKRIIKMLDNKLGHG